MTQQANSYNTFVLILAIYSLKLNSWVVKKKKIQIPNKRAQ